MDDDRICHKPFYSKQEIELWRYELSRRDNEKPEDLDDGKNKKINHYFD